MSLETLKTKVGLLIEMAQSGGNTDELEAIIDNSGVLDSTEGTVEEKVEQLINETGIYKDIMHYLSFSNRTISLTDRFRDYQGTKLPKFNFANKTNVTRCYYSCTNVKSIDWYINTDICTNAYSFLANMSNLTSMVGVNTTSMTNVSYLLSDNRLLETIQEPLNFQSVTTNNGVFSKCYELKDIQFVEETIKLSISFADCYSLSAKSIQSIIDGLATVETTQTLTLHADVKAKLTQTQLDTITNKNWNLA